MMNDQKLKIACNQACNNLLLVLLIINLKLLLIKKAYVHFKEFVTCRQSFPSEFSSVSFMLLAHDINLNTFL